MGGGDPKQRVGQALMILGGARPADVMPLLAELDEDELLALLPPLAEVGGRLVPELLARLEAPGRALRQAATILLGLARDRRAIDPLTARLGAESSVVWIDVARALGNFGPAGRIKWRVVAGCGKPCARFLFFELVHDPRRS